MTANFRSGWFSSKHNARRQKRLSSDPRPQIARAHKIVVKRPVAGVVPVAIESITLSSLASLIDVGQA